MKNGVKTLLITALLAALALSNTGCWQVIALQGAMAAAGAVGAETDVDPTPEYRKSADKVVDNFFDKNRYEMKPEDEALSGLPGIETPAAQLPASERSSSGGQLAKATPDAFAAEYSLQGKQPGARIHADTPQPPIPGIEPE